MNRIDLKYGKTSFCFGLEETKDSIYKTVEDHKKKISKMKGFSFSVNASKVYKDYEAAKKKAK